MARADRGGWLADARRAPVADVALALGLDLAADGRSFGPCPSCGEATRANDGRRDRRGRCRVFPDGGGWACCSNGSDGCGAHGDALSLVALMVAGGPWTRGDVATGEAIRDWYATRGWCEAADGAPPARPATRPPRARPTSLAAPTRPPPLEVASLWFRCLPVSADPEVAAWLEGRGMDPGEVAGADLARALPCDGLLPRWTRYRGRSWRDTGHRLVVAAHEPDPDRPGLLALASLHARAVIDCDAGDKAAWPAGASAAGLIMAADPWAPMADGEARGLVTICEGVPDWLTLALAPATARGALIGGWSGSATPATAAMVPAGWTVALLQHDDAGGDRQANAWRELLPGRTLHRKRLSRAVA